MDSKQLFCINTSFYCIADSIDNAIKIYNKFNYPKRINVDSILKISNKCYYDNTII